MNFFVVLLIFFLAEIPKGLQEVWSEIDSIYVELDLLKDDIKDQEDLIQSEFKKIQDLKNDIKI